MEEKSSKERLIPVTDGSEAIIELFNALGVDYIFLNPGSDIYPIQAAVYKYRSMGKPCPKLVLCLHESVAMAAAHSYFMISGKPQVVLVHVDLGLQQIGGALHNAQRGRVSVLLCSGTAMATQGERGSGRSHPTAWIQDQFDLNNIVRNYVKWHYELRYPEQIQEVIPRAFQIALTEPTGPVYLALSREVLVAKMGGVKIPSLYRHRAPSTAQADMQTLSQAADMLLGAENPLIITGYSGRHPESVTALVRLAETLGARVVTAEVRMNFPSTHPLCACVNPLSGPGNIDHYLEEADVILAIDHDVPYVPGKDVPSASTRIIHLDVDPVKKDIPLWLLPADISIEADSKKAIPLLRDIIEKKIDPETRRHIGARAERLGKEHREERESRRLLAESKADDKPISAEWLCYCINNVIDDDTIILSEVVSDAVSVAGLIDRTTPGSLFARTGSNLGWALGAALGAKLAAPDKLVVSLMGDGGFIFGCPTPALWAAGRYHAPFLSVIFNNQSYRTMKQILKRAYGINDFLEEEDFPIGVDIRPSPDYALIAQANHAYGRKVEDPADLMPALREAIDRVRHGKPAVLDVRVTGS